MSGQPLNHIHRRLADADLYFVANPQPYELTATCSFRVTGKMPEFWWPESGRRTCRRVPGRRRRDACRRAARQRGSVFVVFRGPRGPVDPIVALHAMASPWFRYAAAPVPVIVTQGSLRRAGRSAAHTRCHREGSAQGGQGGVSLSGTTMAEGDDPAHGAVKTLVVDYTIEGKPFTVKALDGSMIQLTREGGPSPDRQGRYGVLNDPQRTRDVREKLQRLVDAGESSFRVARMAEGDDPAFLVVKTLELEYHAGINSGTSRAPIPT